MVEQIFAVVLLFAVLREPKYWTESIIFFDLQYKFGVSSVEG